MKFIKNLALIILSLTLISADAAAQAKKKSIKTAKIKATKSITKPKTENPMPIVTSDYKILIQGAYSKVETPFVFVARDAETYALIRGLVEGLPASSTVDFSKTAVVAAFAGTKNTGGYAVTIQPAGNKIVVDTRAPGKGMMTTQVITTPFQVAAVPVSEMQALSLELAPSWTSQMKMYRVTRGSFEYSGGVAGRAKKFDVEGTVGVLNYGSHVTYNFNLSGKGSEGQRKLSEMTSGIINAGKTELARLDAGTFSEMPRPALKASGAAVDNKLSLTFEPHPTVVADGFSARGKLEAVKIK
jgi:hypothetical protein